MFLKTRHAVGDVISWKSQGGGGTTRKTGTILAIVSKDNFLPSVMSDLGLAYSKLTVMAQAISCFDRYLVRVDRQGKKGQPLEPWFYAPNVVTIDKTWKGVSGEVKFASPEDLPAVLERVNRVHGKTLARLED